jgi:hypothetical protein
LLLANEQPFLSFLKRSAFRFVRSSLNQQINSMASRAIILQGNPRPLTANTSVFRMKSDVHEVYRTADTYWLCLDPDNGSTLEKGNEGLAYNFIYLAGCV